MNAALNGVWTTLVMARFRDNFPSTTDKKEKLRVCTQSHFRSVPVARRRDLGVRSPISRIPKLSSQFLAEYYAYSPRKRFHRDIMGWKIGPGVFSYKKLRFAGSETKKI